METQSDSVTSSATHAAAGTVWLIDRDASRQIDAEAMKAYGLQGLVLMENAARAVASQALNMIGWRPVLHGGRHAHAAESGNARPRIAIVCGAGNNGGDGYAAARHLHNAGCDVQLIALSQPRPDSDAAINAEICRRMQIPSCPLAELVAAIKDADLVIDALFGTGLDRDITGEPADAIALMNEIARPTLAVDAPSGLDCQRGQELGEAIRALSTVTFVGVKPGFLHVDALRFTGTIYVAGIGVPTVLLEQHARPLREEDLPPGSALPELI